MKKVTVLHLKTQKKVEVKESTANNPKLLKDYGYVKIETTEGQTETDNKAGGLLQTNPVKDMKAETSDFDKALENAKTEFTETVDQEAVEFLTNLPAKDVLKRLKEVDSLPLLKQSLEVEKGKEVVRNTVIKALEKRISVMAENLTK